MNTSYGKIESQDKAYEAIRAAVKYSEMQRAVKCNECSELTNLQPQAVWPNELMGCQS